MAKEIRDEITLADVTLVIAKTYDCEIPDALLGDLKNGIKSLAYRAGASKAFKGVKDRASLGYEDKVKRLEKGMTDVGLTIISHEAYVAPERETGMKRAAKLYDELIAKGKDMAEAAKKVDYDGDLEDKVAFIAAIHAKIQNPF